MGNKSTALAGEGNKRVYIVGPSSTGKTTLCDALAQQLDLSKDTTYITEVARRVIQERRYTREDVHLLKMQEDIMSAQIQREQDTRDLYPLQVIDRSALDPLVYARLTGTDEDDSKERIERLLASEALQETLIQYRKPTSLFVLLAPVEEWLIDDGVRHLDDLTRTIELFRDVLSELHIEYLEVGEEEKDLAKRVAIVLDAVDKLMLGPRSAG